MATYSSITVKMIDGSYKSIYCHFDGYIRQVGRILFEHYNTQEKVEALIALGNLSTLAASPECPEGHSFDNRVEGYCVAYGRDRGERQQHASTGPSVYASLLNGVGVQTYNYIWEDGNWRVYSGDGGTACVNKNARPLTAQVIAANR